MALKTTKKKSSAIYFADKNLRLFLRAISNDDSSFNEITIPSEKKAFSLQKKRCYSLSGIAYAHEDFFGSPENCRIFCQARTSTKENKPYYFFKSVRAVSRNNPLNLFPSELSTLNKEQILELFDSETLTQNPYHTSTMTLEDKIKMKDLVTNTNQNKAYEIGGLIGQDPNQLKNLVLLYNIGKLCINEEWDLVLQTIHPKHAKFYENTPYPYKRLTQQPYLDYFNRPAITLYLKRKEFKEKFNEIESNLTKNIAA